MQRNWQKMITGISGTDMIRVEGIPHSMPYINTASLSAGQLRFNPQSSCIEIYDGNIWHRMPSAHSTVDLSYDAREAVTWAKKKMLEEKKLDALCEKYPGLAKARENFEVFKRMVESEESA